MNNMDKVDAVEVYLTDIKQLQIIEKYLKQRHGTENADLLLTSAEYRRKIGNREPHTATVPSAALL